MHWVIQENCFNEKGYTKLIDTLERFNFSHTIVKVIPFGGGILPDVEVIDTPVIVMGAYTLCKVAKEKCWSPGSFDNENFNFVTQEAHWLDKMFNYNCGVYKFSEVPEQEGDFFIRPVHDTKSFTGFVTDWHEFSHWRTTVMGLQTSYCSINSDTQVQVAPAKTIYAEYRLWVVDGKIITSSLYKRGGYVYTDETVDEDIIEFGYSCIREWVPARAFCLDIFVGEDGPKIGEINNINAAGFYAADIHALVQALNDLE
jgi:hypothetical protein